MIPLKIPESFKGIFDGTEIQGQMSPEVPFLYEDNNVSENRLHMTNYRKSCGGEVIKRVDHA